MDENDVAKIPVVEYHILVLIKSYVALSIAPLDTDGSGIDFG